MDRRHDLKGGGQAASTRLHWAVGLRPAAGTEVCVSPLEKGHFCLLMDGGRCRIRTYDFHRVKVALYR